MQRQAQHHLDQQQRFDECVAVEPRRARLAGVLRALKNAWALGTENHGDELAALAVSGVERFPVAGSSGHEGLKQGRNPCLAPLLCNTAPC
jgi:hypothetical protein